MTKGNGRHLSRRHVIQAAAGLGVAAAAAACSVAGNKPKGDAASSAAPQGTPNTLPPPPTPTPVSGVLLCRDAWGARPPRPGGRPHNITRMTIHHTAVVLGDNRNSPARLRQHQRYHQDDHGWIDIAYHMSVDRHGNIYQLRDTHIAGDTATDYDTTGHFLVVCEGDFDQEQVTEAQLQGAALAFAWAAKTFKISSATLASHQEVTPTTACPGANLEAHLVSGDLKRRIDEMIATGAVDLRTVCGTEGAAVVAAIEAGR